MSPSLSSSSFSSPMISPKKYKVFLSYKMVDTGDKFTSHLHYALRREGIETFIDYDLKKGDKILSGLLKAIENSEISIIIFSKNFVYSEWCLDELVKIVECMKTQGQIVIPVFYHVDPRDILNQTRSFKDVFVDLEKRCSHVDKLQKWKDALVEVSNICGWDSSTTRPESKLVEEIVIDVKKKLERRAHIEQINLYNIHLSFKYFTSVEDHTISQKFCCFMGFCPDLNVKEESEKCGRSVDLADQFTFRREHLKRTICNRLRRDFDPIYFCSTQRSQQFKRPKPLKRWRDDLLKKIRNILKLWEFNFD